MTTPAALAREWQRLARAAAQLPPPPAKPAPVPYVDVSYITEYGMTVRLSSAVRVF